MELNYKSFGSGIPVVILHGLLGSLDNWQTFARQLSAGFCVFTLDLRNHGRSPHSPEHSYAAMSADLLEFFNQHHIEKAHLIGHSMGGKVAMQFAINHPEKVLKLFVVDISPRAYSGTHDLILEALQGINLEHIAKREEADVLLAAKIPDAAVRQFLLKNLDRTATGFQWKINLNALVENYQRINIAIEALAPVPVPAVVIRGGRSSYVTENDFSLFRKIFTSVEFVTIEGAGHWVHADAPAEFFEAIMKRLSPGK